MLFLTKVFVSDRGHEEDRILGPFLDTGEVEEGETAGTAPHLESEGERDDGCYEVVQTGSVCVCVHVLLVGSS